MHHREDLVTEPCSVFEEALELDGDLGVAFAARLHHLVDLAERLELGVDPAAGPVESLSPVDDAKPATAATKAIPPR